MSPNTVLLAGRTTWSLVPAEEDLSNEGKDNVDQR